MKAANLLAALALAIPAHSGAIESKQPVTYTGIKWTVTGETNLLLCEQMSALQLDLTGPGDGATFTAAGAATCKGGILAASGTAIIMRNDSGRYLAISIFLADSRISCMLDFSTLSSNSCQLFSVASNQAIAMLSLTFQP